jgi:phosphotriesterase-related protein
MVKEGLKNFKKIKINNLSNGNASIIDCQPAYCGRNGNKLLELSILTSINIISVTGFHKKDYYPPEAEIWKMNKVDAENFFIKEIKGNLLESPELLVQQNDKKNKVQAGAIKIAFTAIYDSQYKILTEAAVDASMATGVPIIVHTERGLQVEKLVDFFERKEILLSKIMLCHMDKRPDLKLHKYLADKSIFLEYDTFNRPKYNPEKNVWPLLIEMIKEGYSSSIMIGTDLANSQLWKNVSNYGGLGHFFESITEKLLGLDVEISDIENIIKINAQNYLCIN